LPVKQPNRMDEQRNGAAQGPPCDALAEVEAPDAAAATARVLPGECPSGHPDYRAAFVLTSDPQ
jgi:hypothetical protein